MRLITLLEEKVAGRRKGAMSLGGNDGPGVDPWLNSAQRACVRSPLDLHGKGRCFSKISPDYQPALGKAI
jgi:hypothetical protein